ncbi:TolC family protein [Amniculibacterium aquaticum]|uniref:TolC family protein n=1 Tax=Amniculibacterium aquaticum TaxID=2479858 RepID=UPI000F5AFA3A|nr:TolC family protein [Amniculibacterium aquaticum]
MFKMNLKLCIILFFLMISKRISSQKLWTLEDCISYAENNNLRIKQSKINIEAQENILKISQKDYLPTVGISANGSMNFGQNVLLGTLQRNDNFSHNLSANASINLYNGGRISKTIAKNKSDYSVAQYDFENTKYEINLQLIQNFLQILLQKEIYKINLEAKNYAQKMYEKTRLTTEAGITSKAIEQESYAEMIRKNQLLENAINEIDKAKLQLTSLLQLENYQDFDVSDLLESSDYTMQNTDIEKLIAEAYRNNPSVQAAKQKIQSAKQQTEISKTNYLPSVTLTSGVGSFFFQYFNKDFNSSVPFWQQYNNNFGQQIGVSVSVPVFNKGNAKLQQQQGYINQKIAENNLEITKQQLRSNVQKSYLDYESKLKNHKAILASMEATQLSFSYAEKSFLAGKINIYELNTAKNNLMSIEGNLAQSKYNLIFGRFILNYLVYFKTMN